MTYCNHHPTLLLFARAQKDGHKFVPITESSLFPSNILGLHNHIQICNSYTMSPANRSNDEGNPKLQRMTCVVLRVTTKYAFDHIIGLIQLYLTEMNLFVKEKEMPSLNTRTHLAIIGMTANWCRYLSGRLFTRTLSITCRTPS
jgi:hypothetical protein